jgi:hypothetical protein
MAVMPAEQILLSCAAVAYLCAAAAYLCAAAAYLGNNENKA